MRSQFSFFPAISLKRYITGYPWLFGFGLAAGLAHFFERLLPILILLRAEENPVFRQFVQTLELSAFVFLAYHLAINAGLLSWVRYRSLVPTLAIAGLFLYFFWSLSDAAITTRPLFLHLCALLGMTAFLAPLHQAGYRPALTWRYIVQLLMAALSGLVVWGVLKFVAGYLYMGSYWWSGGYLLSQIEPVRLMGFFLLPWYLVGAVENTFQAPAREEDGRLKVNRVLLYTLLILTVLSICVVYFMILQWALAKQEPSAGLLTMGLASLALVMLSFWVVVHGRDDEGEPWVGDYLRWMSVFSLPVFGYIVAVLVKTNEHQGLHLADYYYALALLWAAVFLAYHIVARRPDPFKPLRIAWILLLVTSLGPLSYRAVLRRDHQARLKQELADFHILSGGKIAGTPISVDGKIYSSIEDHFRTIVQYSGTRPLQPWFEKDLGSLKRSRQETDYYDEDSAAVMVAQQFMRLCGLEECGTIGYQVLNKYFSCQRGILDVSGYQEQDEVYIGTGCPTDVGDRGPLRYRAYMTSQNQVLHIDRGRTAVADIPVKPFLAGLTKYDYNEIIRQKVPPENLTLVYEDGKVRVKLCLNTIQVASNGPNDTRMTGGSGKLLVGWK